MTKIKPIDAFAKRNKALRKRRLNNKKYLDKRISYRMKEHYIKPIEKICVKCKKRRVQFHHLMCQQCWNETKLNKGENSNGTTTN